MSDQTQTKTQIPTDKQIESLIADVQAIRKRIQAFAVDLTPAERLGVTKMRTGGADVVAAVAHLAEDHQIVLPEVSVDGMLAELARAQRVRPLAEVVRQLGRTLDDTVIHAQGECWWAATALYTSLSRIAAARPSLREALRPIVTFFAIGARKKTPPTGTPVAPPSGA